MIHGGIISGAVHNNRGMPVENVEVKAYDINLRGWFSWGSTVRTDRAGNYTLRALWPGTYHVEFTAYIDEQWITEYYGNEHTFEQATDVTVRGDSVTSEIDVIFGPDTVVYMPVVAGSSK